MRPNLCFLVLAVLVLAKPGFGRDSFGSTLFNHFLKSAFPSLFSSGNSGTEYDPLEDFRKSTNSILRSSGYWKLGNGDERSNLGHVTGQVKVRRASLESVMYYWNYALLLTCESSLERWDCPHCKVLGGHIQLLKIHYNFKYHTKWIVTVDPRKQEIVLTFRPSLNVANYLQLLDFKLTKLNGTECASHSGFLAMIDADWEEIVKSLRQTVGLYPTYKLIITGYSLGGSLSVITTFYLKYYNIFPHTTIELYTYGQPRTGNKAFVDYINSLDIVSVRVVNRDDTPSRFIPAFLGYYHQHNELFLNFDPSGNRTAVYCSTAVYEDPDCGQSRGPIYSIFNFFLGVVDHLTYFGTNSLKCPQSNILELALQAVWPLRQYIPKEILDRLPPLAVETTLVQDIAYLFGGGGIRNLYQIAAKSKLGNNNLK